VVDLARGEPVGDDGETDLDGAASLAKTLAAVMMRKPLLDAAVRTPEQLRQVNALCRLVEMVRPWFADRPRYLAPQRPCGGQLCTSHAYCCTVLVVATMNVSAARENLPEAVTLARTEAVILERYGRPAAVLVSPERYEQLMSALEDVEDVAAFDAAMAEEGPNIPWEQVKADLGWT
jgi:antitoxin Phd